MVSALKINKINKKKKKMMQNSLVKSFFSPWIIKSEIVKSTTKVRKPKYYNRVKFSRSIRVNMLINTHGLINAMIYAAL